MLMINLAIVMTDQRNMAMVDTAAGETSTVMAPPLTTATQMQKSLLLLPEYGTKSLLLLPEYRICLIKYSCSQVVGAGHE